MDNHDPRKSLKLANSYARSGQREKALTLVEQALSVSRHDLSVMADAVVLLHQLGATEQALKTVDAWLTEAPIEHARFEEMTEWRVRLDSAEAQRTIRRSGAVQAVDPAPQIPKNEALNQNRDNTPLVNTNQDRSVPDMPALPSQLTALDESVPSRGWKGLQASDPPIASESNPLITTINDDTARSHRRRVQSCLISLTTLYLLLLACAPPLWRLVSAQDTVSEFVSAPAILVGVLLFFLTPFLLGRLVPSNPRLLWLGLVEFLAVLPVLAIWTDAETALNLKISPNWGVVWALGIIIINLGLFGQSRKVPVADLLRFRFPKAFLQSCTGITIPRKRDYRLVWGVCVLGVLVLGVWGATIIRNRINHSSLSPTAAKELAHDINEILGLVEKGDLFAAHIRVLFLLKQYPNEPRLVKLSKKLSTALDAAVQIPANDNVSKRRRISFQQLSASKRNHLMSLEKRLVELGNKGRESSGTEVVELLAAINEFNSANPDLPRGWLIQARLSLATNRSQEGQIAAKNLIELGVYESASSEVHDVMKQLANRGWLPGPTTASVGVSAKP